jgi:phospholipid/cholesterol/gamma-HCH transport system ATP-binding protein
MRFLASDLGITIFVVTHDLDTLLGVTDRVIVLSEGRVLADGPVGRVMQAEDPWVRAYFGARTTVPAEARHGT